MVAARNNLRIQITSSAAQTSAARGFARNKQVSGGVTDYRGRVRAPQVRHQAPRSGGQFEAENDAGEAAKARGNPFHRQRGSPKRDGRGQRGQQPANDSHDDHGNDRARANFFGFKALFVDRRRPVLQVALDACLLDGAASLRPVSPFAAGFKWPCVMLSDSRLN